MWQHMSGKSPSSSQQHFHIYPTTVRDKKKIPFRPDCNLKFLKLQLKETDNNNKEALLHDTSSQLR